MKDFNPRSPDGERRGFDGEQDDGVGISIHAPRMGSDRMSPPAAPWTRDFNPRSPDGERPKRTIIHSDPLDFNPRSPDGERPYYHLAGFP